MQSEEVYYIEKISKESFEVLYAIGFWNFTSLDYAQGISSELGVSYASVLEEIDFLETKKLIEVERRDEQIYAASLTEQGRAVFHDPEYSAFKEELGC